MTAPTQLAEPTAPRGRFGRGLGGKVRVVLGRGVARGAIQLSLLGLLPVWGADAFGRYVAATGAFTWVVGVVLGVEKAALTAVPRTRLLAAQTTRMLIGRAAALFAAGLLAAAALSPVGGAPALYGLAAANAAGMGLLSVLAAVHRLADHPERDSFGYAGYAVWVLGMGGLALAGVLRPYGYLLALTTGLVVACAVLAWLVPALRTRPTHRRDLARLLNRRVVLLGLTDVTDSAGVSILFVVLAAVDKPADSALVYLMLLVSSTLGSFGILVLRLIQPSTSLRLRGTGGASGRLRARTMLGRTAIGAGGIAVATTGALLTARSTLGPDALAAIGRHPLAIGGLVLVEMTSFCMVVYAVFLLENTNGAVLSLTTSAALASLVATVATALVVVTTLGAVGAFLALVVGLAVKAAVLHARLRPHPVIDVPLPD
ncbi:hypothetical protein UO65_4479 [Actinokineospora spheciospongiae]|uniref:Uncharacterized protein n=1 Tax=Actinokineospora spheciospongiae TaxID=909613 RepID=W7IJ10_9PSEU|nr:hypothetical protein [Actinokineospora spheciospongiae]EWC60233.1 hypothetical protein UO65_4479 [Actinokineospora spheciospongiae]